MKGNQTNEVITDKNIKSNNEEFKSNKQIEEMAKIMLEQSQRADVEPVLEIDGKEIVLGENATIILNNVLEQAFIPFLAELLYNAGYRKERQGEWIDLYKGKYENKLYACSVCRKGAFLRVEADELNTPRTVQALTPYCPNCGAKMKGGAE